MTTITVSKLPNINFYTGEDSHFGGESVENRRYGVHSNYYGDLSLSSANNSYWSYISNSTFGENPTNYNNIGDIMNTTISYMNKFKNNTIEISINKNILTFNYKYEEDLESDYNNTSIIPASELINLLLNVNDMTFNKRNYYRNNIELKEITYAHKKYQYNGPNTIITVNDESSETGFKTYDFSRQFVNYNYTVLSYDEQYTRSYMEPYNKADGTIGWRDTGITYIETKTFYSYELNDVNELNNRINTFFDNNTNAIENKYGDLKTYYLSDLDTVLKLTLNTHSLGSKNLYAYFNFSGQYDNWYDNSIAFTMNTTNINNNDKLLSIEPINENWFNVIVNDYDKPCGEDIQLNDLYDFNIINKDILEDTQKFKIINPSNIKTIDLSNNTENITNIDLINNYNKKIDVNTFKNTNWMAQNPINIENLIIGNSTKNSSVKVIYGINNLSSLKTLDITNCNQLEKEFSINKLSNLNEFKAKGSNIKNFIPKQNTYFNVVTLPESLKTLVLRNVTINSFDYTPTNKLINLTMDNIKGEGIQLQKFVEDWIDSLEEENVLYSGVIQKTNLTNLNFNNFDVNRLLKFQYLGLNKFSGKINIKDGDLTRKEYLQLKDVFGDDIMNNNNQDIEFEYTIENYNPNTNEFTKNVYVKWHGNNSSEWIYADDVNGNIILKMNVINNVGGNSLLDYFETINSLELTRNKGNFGYEINLSNPIYTDNNEKSSLTKQLLVGDIVLYKGKKLIFVTQNHTSVYNYIKLGKLNFTTNADEIVIDFNI